MNCCLRLEPTGLISCHRKRTDDRPNIDLQQGKWKEQHFLQKNTRIAECEAEYYCVQSHCDTVINSNLFSKHVNRASGYSMCCQKSKDRVLLSPFKDRNPSSQNNHRSGKRAFFNQWYKNITTHPSHHNCQRNLKILTLCWIFTSHRPYLHFQPYYALSYIKDDTYFMGSGQGLSSWLSSPGK